MANDIDLWGDIRKLEKIGQQEEADSLMKIYQARYIEFDKTKVEQAKRNHFNKYSYIPKI